MKTLLAFIALPSAAIAGLAVYDGTEQHRRYEADYTFSGHRVIVERTSGALGLRSGEKIVGYFLAGKPRLVGFGCEGSAPDAVLIGMEEDAFPRCKRIEAVEAR